MDKLKKTVVANSLAGSEMAEPAEQFVAFIYVCFIVVYI